MQGCGKLQTTGAVAAQDSAPPGGNSITADVPGANISDTLKLIKGRWVQEIVSEDANPQTMRLFASADNTLSGRFLVGGGFTDTGLAATLRQEGDVFTFTLVDDELRPHDSMPNMPKTRTFRGTYDATRKTLSLEGDGEFVHWEFTGNYTAYYTAHIFRCVLIPAPQRPGAPATPAAARPPSSSAPNPGTARWVTPLNWLIAPSYAMAEPRPIPAPTSSAAPAVSRTSCRVMDSDHEEWSRLSGAY